MNQVDMQRKLRALEEAALANPPAISSDRQPLLNSETASILPILQQLSVLYRVNRLIHREFDCLQRVYSSKHLELIGEKVTALLKVLCQQNRKICERLRSIASVESVGLLQLLPLQTAEQTV